MTKKEAGLESVTSRVAAVEEKFDSIDKKLDKLDNLLTLMEGFNQWRPSVDKELLDAYQSVRVLMSRVETLESHPVLVSTNAPPREEEVQANDHCQQHVHQGRDARALVLHPALVTGEHPPPDQPYCSPTVNLPLSPHTKEYRLPKTDFPRFDGIDPKLWKDKAEKYFRLFKVPAHMWSPFATMHFNTTAARWLQTYEAQHSVETWAELCVALVNKYGKDNYHHHMKDILQCRQTEDVTSYHTTFNESMHKVLMHNEALDDIFFATKFVEGLKPQIRNALMLHKPRTVDAALSLALMQEEMLEHNQKRYSVRNARHYTGGGVNPERPSSSADKGVLGAAPTEEKSSAKPQGASKFDSLRAQRKARGECFKCGAKYGPNHKCPKHVPLHILEELLEVIQID